MENRSPDIRRMAHDQAEWISTLLARRDPRRTVMKLGGEVMELMEAVTLGSKEVEGEVADCLILLLDVCVLHGIDPVEAFYNKLDINKNREWQPSGGCLQHKEK